MEKHRMFTHSGDTNRNRLCDTRARIAVRIMATGSVDIAHLAPFGHHEAALDFLAWQVSLTRNRPNRGMRLNALSLTRGQPWPA